MYGRQTEIYIYITRDHQVALYPVKYFLSKGYNTFQRPATTQRFRTLLNNASTQRLALLPYGYYWRVIQPTTYLPTYLPDYLT